MKRCLTSTSMVLCFFFSAISVTNAQIDPFKICFTDGFGYLWKYSLTNDGSDPAYYTGQGTCTLGDGNVWFASGTGYFPNGALSTGTIELKAVNPYPDQCKTQTDSFTYSGTGIGILTTAGITKWTGSGSWLSYCFGGVVNSGAWSASGSKKECSQLLGRPVNKNGITPAGAKSISTITVRATPNPMITTTNIQYVLDRKAQVNITIYDMMNQPVAVLVNDIQEVGKYSIKWNGSYASGLNAPTGLYKVMAVIDGVSTSTSLQIVR